MSNQKNSHSTRTWLLYVMVVVLVAATATLIYRIADHRKTEQEGFLSAFGFTNLGEKADEQFESAQSRIEETRQSISKSSFNSKFEVYAGREGGTAAENVMTDIITNNKKNADQQISVVFDGIDCGTDVGCIADQKDKIVVWHGSKLAYYEISYDYDADGYINKATITSKE